jgi:hypothetical protein
MKMMRPQLARLMAGRYRRARRTPLKTLTSKNRNQSESGISSNGFGSKMPRLLTRICTWGWCCASFSATTAVLRSPAKPTTSPPVFAFSSATASSTDDCERPLTITRAPSCARLVAIARPIPAVLPLTRASLPCRSRFMTASFQRMRFPCEARGRKASNCDVRVLGRPPGLAATRPIA